MIRVIFSLVVRGLLIISLIIFLYWIGLDWIRITLKGESVSAVGC